MTVKRGEIYWVELDPVKGSEQGGLRPALIVQQDVGNRYSPTSLPDIDFNVG
jgi:mRNA interferase MazF